MAVHGVSNLIAYLMLKLMFNLVDMSGIFEGCLLALTRSRQDVHSRTKTVSTFPYDEIRYHA